MGLLEERQVRFWMVENLATAESKESLLGWL